MSPAQSDASAGSLFHVTASRLERCRRYASRPTSAASHIQWRRKHVSVTPSDAARGDFHLGHRRGAVFTAQPRCAAGHQLLGAKRRHNRELVGVQMRWTCNHAAPCSGNGELRLPVTIAAGAAAGTEFHSKWCRTRDIANRCPA